MKNLLKLILVAVFFMGAVPADTIIQEAVTQETIKQCSQVTCQTTLADAEEVKKKKKKKRKKAKKPEKERRRKKVSFPKSLEQNNIKTI